MTHKNLDANKTNSDAFTLASYTCTTGIRSDGVGLQGGTTRGYYKGVLQGGTTRGYYKGVLQGVLISMRIKCKLCQYLAAYCQWAANVSDTNLTNCA